MEDLQLLFRLQASFDSYFLYMIYESICPLQLPSMDFASPEAMSSRFGDVTTNFPPIDTHGGDILEVTEVLFNSILS